ncbi:xanthine dehydrogenase YagR molybdenum-binding subunit [Burkholderiaceae bacterium]|nr:xanthine dehydrogenase YagR molybdenum-binding subunit [Burkholderiaceae bacterium]
MKPVDLRRRRFLIAGSLASGELLVGCAAPSSVSRLGDREVFHPTGDQVALNGWVKITPEGKVIVATPRSEMGQGVHTALAMLVAEELDAPWSDVSVEQAPIARIYANAALLLNVSPFLPDDDGFMARTARSSLQRLGYALSLQVTGGSSSIRDAWEPMRLAGASARAMLVQAAAQRFGVPAAQCSAVEGVVAHPASGRTARFGELVRAAAELDPPRDVALKSPKDFRLIGKPVPRTDIADKVNGRAVFGIDVRPAGLCHAAIRHCPVFGGTVKSFDGSAARHMRGVKNVFQLGASAVVAVADNTWRACSALDRVDIVWDEGPNARLSSADISAQLRRELDAHGGSGFRSEGDAKRVLASAARKVEALYEVPFLAHAAMEPINCVAQVSDGRVTVWNSTQVPSFARMRAAKVAGVDVDKVTLHVPYLGGGFGRRLEFDMVEEAVAIAMKTGGAPVKLTWSREEDMQHDMYRPAAVARFAAALDDAGRPLAWLNRVCAPSVGLGTMERLMPSLAMDMPDKNHIEGAFDLPYDIANLSVRQIRSKTPVPVGSWRSVGHSYNAFFTECFIDELAHAARQDPYAYRRSLLGRHPRHRAVLELAAAQAGWGRALPAGRARGIALHESFGSICAQVAEVSVAGGEVRVHRVVCALDCGTVVNPDTVEAQMQGAIVYGLSAALHGEITIKGGRVEQGNFPSYDTVKLAGMPRIDTHIVPSNAPPGGVGEPGTPPIAPAVANALFALTGKRLRKLPLRLDELAG